MKGMIKTKHVYVMTLLFSIFIVYAGLANAETSIPTLNKPDQATQAKLSENYGKLPLSFVQNDGQIDEKVKFYERGSWHSAYFTSEGVYLELISRKETKAVEEKNQNTPKSVKQPIDEIQNLKSEIIKLTPIGANKNPKIIAEGVQIGKVNYFIGNDPEKWKTNIPTYEVVVYKDIYKSIDMKFYGNNRQMEYDIIVKPGADLSQVQLSYEGIEGLSITGNGKMEIALKACPEQERGNCRLIQNKPYCYQEINGKKVEVDGDFRILKTKGKMQKATEEYGKEQTHTEDGHKQRFVYNFHIASYDKSHPLIIDPVLVLAYSTYLGGSGYDWGFGIAVDTSENAYVTGYTESPYFPTVSAFDDSHNGG